MDSAPLRNGKSIFRDLYPNWSDEVIQEAEENWRRYLALVWRIHLRLQDELASHPSEETVEEESDTTSGLGGL